MQTSSPEAVRGRQCAPADRDGLGRIRRELGALGHQPLGDGTPHRRDRRAAPFEVFRADGMVGNETRALDDAQGRNFVG